MSKLLRYSVISSVALAALLVAGCSKSTAPLVSPDTADAKASAPAVPVTAKIAFGALYKSARSWSPDVEILRMTPKELTGFKNAEGKAGMWEAVFAAPSKGQYRVYTYSVATVLPEVHKGTSANLALAWAGPSRDAMPIDLALFNVDSDAGYQAAAADAATWLKKNPGEHLAAFELGSNYKFHAPVWYASWGDKKNGYIAFVDATSGKVYESK
jgi:hypothetical protein